eukprot:495769-Amphidinium_carterae.1
MQGMGEQREDEEERAAMNGVKWAAEMEQTYMELHFGLAINLQVRRSGQMAHDRYWPFYAMEGQVLQAAWCDIPPDFVASRAQILPAEFLWQFCWQAGGSAPLCGLAVLSRLWIA